MFDGLDDVPWSELTHAYGDASDVPDQLRALASHDSSARDAALEELFGNIHHQGTVFSATTRALPFLINLLAEPSVPDRKMVALLVAHIIAGRGYYQVHARADFINPFTRKPMEWPADLDERLQKEANVVAKVRAEGRRALEYLLPLLDDPDALLRGSVAKALGCYPEHADRFLPLLEGRRAAEDDEAALRYVDGAIEQLLEAQRAD